MNPIREALIVGGIALLCMACAALIVVTGSWAA